MEKTFAMIKPDGVQRNLCGEIISRLEKKGIKIVALKMTMVSRELAEEHYAEHNGKSFFGNLVDFITSGPVIAMVLAGDQVISQFRTLMGATDPKDALPGTIRGDLALRMDQNIIHGSDSPVSAAREIRLFFPEIWSSMED